MSVFMMLRIKADPKRLQEVIAADEARVAGDQQPGQGARRDPSPLHGAAPTAPRSSCRRVGVARGVPEVLRGERRHPRRSWASSASRRRPTSRSGTRSTRRTPSRRARSGRPRGCRVVARSSAVASPNTSVWRSTSAARRRRRHQRHVVERRHEDAAVQRVEVHEPVEIVVHRRRRLAAGARPLGLEAVLGPAAEPGDVPVEAVAADRRLDAVGEPLGQRDHPLERLVREDVLERRAHGPQREGVPGQGAADAADVDRPGGSAAATRRAVSSDMPYAAAGTPLASGFPTVRKSGSRSWARV